MEDLDRCWVVVKGCDGRGSCSLKNDLDGGLVNGYWSLGTESAMFLRVDQSETDQTNFKGMTEILETISPIKIELPLPPDDSNTNLNRLVSGSMEHSMSKQAGWRDLIWAMG